jgi:hypothetical protein
MTEDSFRELYAVLPEELCQPCAICRGLGVVPRRAPAHVEVTCWPTGSSAELGHAEGDRAVTVNHGDAERYLAIDIALRDVATLSPLARIAIEAYYRPKETRIRAITGRRLHAPAPQATAWEALHELTPAANEPESTRGPADAHASRLAREAAELYDHAGRCWNAAAYGAKGCQGEEEPADPDPGDYPDDDELGSGVHAIDAATYLALTEPSAEVAP